MGPARWVILTWLLVSTSVASPLTLLPRTITAPCAAGETANCGTASLATPAIVETSVLNSVTVTEAFFPTSFSELSAVTAATTVTTTDASGATVLAIVGVAGVGYLVYEGLAGAGLVQLDPPDLPEPPPKFSFDPTTTAESTTSSAAPSASSSSSEVYTQTATQDVAFYTPPASSPITLLRVPRDVRSCNGQTDEESEFQLDFATAAISDFCTTHGNDDIGISGVDGVSSLDAGLELNISIAQLTVGCNAALGQFTLTADECNYFLSEAVNGCDTDSNTIKHGGIIQDGCLQYSVMAQLTQGDLQCTPTDLPSLPGLPGGSTDTVKYAATTGLDPDEAKANIEQFCANMTGSDITSQNGERIYYNPSLGNSQMRMSLTYTSQVDCPQSGSDAVYHTTQSSCVRLFDRAIDECNDGPLQGYGKFGGITTDSCGVFAIQTKNVEPILCNQSGRNTVPEDTIDAAIDRFCNSGYHMDPNAAPLDNAAFYNSPPDGYAWDAYIAPNNDVVKTKLLWNSLVQNTECQYQSKRFDVQGSECTRRLKDIWSSCSYGGVMGAQQQEGCVTWALSYTSTVG